MRIHLDVASPRLFALDLGPPVAIMIRAMDYAQRGNRGRFPEPAWTAGPAAEIGPRGAAAGVSVVIPCRSVDSLVPGLLDALQGDPICREVLIVVNGAPKSGRDLVEPPVRTLWLALPGLSAAKNLGLSDSHSEIVAFLDNDTVPDRGWCTALAASFGRHPAATVGGGPIRLAPRIAALGLGPGGRGYLGELDLGDVEVRWQPWRYPYGGNSAVLAAAARAAGGFSEALGYAGGKLVPNEEMDLFRRLEYSGGEVWYTPSAWVTHCVALDHASPRYLLRRAFWQGVADVRTRRRHPDHPLRPVGENFRTVLRASLAAAYHRLAGRRDISLDRALQAMRSIGSLILSRPRV